MAVHYSLWDLSPKVQAELGAENGPVKKTLCRANQYGVKGEKDRSISRNLCFANEAYRAGIFREFPIVGQ